MADEIISFDNGINEESILGYLVGMTFREIKVKKETFEQISEQSSLPDEFKPHFPRPLFVFQIAARKLEEIRTEEFIDPATGAKIFLDVEYFVDVIDSKTRQLSRKIRINPKSANLSEDLLKTLGVYAKVEQKEPEKMALFIFESEKSTKIHKVELFKEDVLNIREQTDEKYQQLLRNFKELTGCYTERYIKDAWHRLCNACAGIPFLLAPGVVRFFPKEYKNLIFEFVKLYNNIYGNYGISRVIPIISSQKVKEYLKQDVEAEIQKRVDRFFESVANKIEKADDPEKIKEELLKKKDDFEKQLYNSLIKQYNELLKIHLDVKLEKLPMPTSVRLQKAREFLLKVK